MLSLSRLRREPTCVLTAVIAAFLAALLFVIPAPLAAQPAHPGAPASAGASAESEPSWPFEAKAAEWKDIRPAVLQMDHHPADSNATAVILSDVGKMFVDRGGDLRFERHKRIKLLSEAAYDEYGTVDIYFTSEDREERVKDVEGHTFILDDNGEVQRIELDSDDVFEEEVTESTSKVTFTLPNLEPGAVIEYKYEMRSENPLQVPTWSFQDGAPTVYSEYEARIPDMLDFVQLKRGDEAFDVNESKRVRKNMEHRWVATNIPALREEPYMTTVEDYRLAIRFQVRSFQNPRTGKVTNFMESWPELAEDLMENDSFGRQLGRHGDVNDRTERLVSGLSTDAERLEAIYDFVSSNVDWDERNRFIPSDDLDDVLERRRGSSADINMLLCSMLQIADMEAYPVLISTRGHGAVVPLYPFVSQFNSVIVAAKMGENYVLLDATDPDLPAGQLPVRDLNKQGWLVKEETPAWVTIPPTGSSSRSTLVRAQIQDNGSVASTITVTDKSYRALRSRKAFREADDAHAYVKSDLLSVESVVESAETSGTTRDEKQMRTSTDVTLPAYAQVAGDFMYINPMILGRFEEAVFEKETRSFPVDVPYPLLDQYTFSLQVPEGYEVKELPEQRIIKGGDGVVFQRLLQVSGNMVSMRITMMVKKTTFAPSEYPEIRTFFDEIVSAHAEPIVLQKASAETEDAAPAPASESSAGDAR